ncbi:TPA: hypothetical protein QDA99_006606 [Burkholderia vietnamiensis]|uniref:hypothetical protein n=1 Tax=Burkholderia vietnamiensis TaxID=60552 RepID=UPI00158B2CDA|nr:hypothetical protein [Burkholderia vietnamiensis]HDR9003031.1 hypothetical protein [Burkholderia vietnamiensis]HDR9006925.1 hypothetical protein [Burkholderia vietnamiensis]
MAKGAYQIPFDAKGNQKGYPDTWGGLEWRDNVPFEDALTYSGYGRGRSSATLHFKRSDGTSVQFFMTDFDDIARHMVNGVLAGRFQFVKRGQNYGCQRIGDAL